MAMRLFLSGTLIRVPPVETALKFLAEHPGDERLRNRPRRRISGSPEKVRRDIEAVAAEYGADEVMVVTITHEHAARRRSYELIAEVFGLTRKPPQTLFLRELKLAVAGSARTCHFVAAPVEAVAA